MIHEKTKETPRLTRLEKGIAGGVLVLFGAASLWMWSESRANSLFFGPPVIALPESLHFGDVWDNDAFRWNVVFENVSNQSMFLHEIGTGCACATIDGPKEYHLQPHERATVNVTIDLRQLRTYDFLEPRPVEIWIIAKVGPAMDQTQEYAWDLEGSVRRLLTCDPLNVGLGEELIRSEPGRLLDFRIRPNIPIRKLALKRVPDGWTAELLPASSGSNEYLLRASACKSKLGKFLDEFELQAIGTDDNVLPSQFVKVEGRVIDTIEILPCPLDLGPLPVGKTVKADFWVFAKGDQVTEAPDVVPSDSLTKVLEVRPNGSKWHITIERQIDACGLATASGLVRFRSHRAPPKEVEYLVRWYGTIP